MAQLTVARRRHWLRQRRVVVGSTTSSTLIRAITWLRFRRVTSPSVRRWDRVVLSRHSVRARVPWEVQPVLTRQHQTLITTSIMTITVLMMVAIISFLTLSPCAHKTSQPPMVTGITAISRSTSASSVRWRWATWSGMTTTITVPLMRVNRALTALKSNSTAT
ncbi:DUF6688 domain-containing protein [Chloroflexus sp. MS-G]|uniref:DUF6688 domain-containing protein n=1 Tax=Chloroflexus sp. MS-G TaxID=1521187 RepID=UPI003FA464F2